MNEAIGCGVVALLEGGSFGFGVFLVVRKGHGLGLIVGEVYVDPLEGCIEGIMALESQETRRRGHGTDRADEADPLAGVEDIAC